MHDNLRIASQDCVTVQGYILTYGFVPQKVFLYSRTQAGCLFLVRQGNPLGFPRRAASEEEVGSVRRLLTKPEMLSSVSHVSLKLGNVQKGCRRKILQNSITHIILNILLSKKKSNDNTIQRNSYCFCTHLYHSVTKKNQCMRNSVNTFSKFSSKRFFQIYCLDLLPVFIYNEHS